MPEPGLTLHRFSSAPLKELLKAVSRVSASLDYDAFGRIYGYSLGEFARTEGQRGGEFYTQSYIVRLLTEVIEPYHGRILDPACGSGGMFVSSAPLDSEHEASPPSARPAGHPPPSGRSAGDAGAQSTHDPARELGIHGDEKTDETGRLCRLNLAVHGLEGDICLGGQVNSYYDDPHKATGQFDFVLANPPFNVNAVDKERLKDMAGPGRRFPFGLPRNDNATATRPSAKPKLAKPDRRSLGETELYYLWIQLFHSVLNKKGRAGLVMANSASDARASEQGIQQELIECRFVDVMAAVGPNMFDSLTEHSSLWLRQATRSKQSLAPEEMSRLRSVSRRKHNSL